MKYLLSFLLFAILFSYSVPQRVKILITHWNKKHIVHSQKVDNWQIIFSSGTDIGFPNMKDRPIVDSIDFILIKE